MLDQKPANHKSPNSAWPLLIGLFGIANSVLGLLILTPPESGQTVNFWLIKFYGYIFFPSLLLFLPGSILAITFWFSRFVNKSWAETVLLTIGGAITCIGLYCSFSIIMFYPSLSIVSEVEQKGHIYYLVKSYDDLAFNYSFCESDEIGFSGTCTPFTWNPSGSADPQFYVEQSTGLITATFDKPKQIWKISTQPTDIYSVQSP